MNAETQDCYDTEKISRDESFRVPETACALANSSGGVIICEGFDPVRLIPHEVPYTAGADGKIYIPPLVWHKKPVILNGRVYRRIEGQNVISGLRAKVIMAGDSHEPSRDDFPVINTYLSRKSVSGFHKKVASLNECMRRFTRDEFLRRTGVYSGDFLTFAGALMLGDIMRVSAVLDYSEGHEQISASNIWDAFAGILPRLLAPLSSRCAEAFRELFINSLLHADYNSDNHINFLITPDPPKVFADNPGIVRRAARNHRLAKMFALSGIISPLTRRPPHGLDMIREYMPSFTLEENMLELRTCATLRLEGKSGLPEPIIL